MLARPGGTAKARAVLNAQFDAVEIATALARTLQNESVCQASTTTICCNHFIGKISAGYVHDVGPTVMAKLHTKK
jgi:hypothetical protein